MRKPVLFIAFFLILPTPTIAAAQPTLRCSDYIKNQDGSWTTLIPVLAGGIYFSPGASFKVGAKVGVLNGGVDIATILNERCKEPPK